jgi:hypothetical protein
VEKHWKVTVWSHPDYEQLVAELCYGDRLLLVVDQDDVGGGTHISFFDSANKPAEHSRVKLEDFLENLKLAVEELRR